MKYISFCLFGNNIKYLTGVKRNLMHANRYYPAGDGWRIIIYHGRSVPVIELRAFKKISSIPLDLVLCESDSWPLMIDRFKAILRPDADAMIVRDADSRFTLRESELVYRWLDSSYLVHSINDHPDHSIPMMGGLWGMKKEALPYFVSFKDILKSWPVEDRWQTDQELLTQVIWPICRQNHIIMRHDHFYVNNFGGFSIDSPRINFEFIGATLDEYGNMVPEQVERLKEFMP